MRDGYDSTPSAGVSPPEAPLRDGYLGSTLTRMEAATAAERASRGFADGTLTWGMLLRSKALSVLSAASEDHLLRALLELAATTEDWITAVQDRNTPGA